jgi:hypothetical protein
VLLDRLLEETCHQCTRCKIYIFIVAGTASNNLRQTEHFQHYDPAEKTDFPITSSLVRLLSHGHKTKMQVDWAIDNCGETQASTSFHMIRVSYQIYVKVTC